MLATLLILIFSIIAAESFTTKKYSLVMPNVQPNVVSTMYVFFQISFFYSVSCYGLLNLTFISSKKITMLMYQDR